MARFRRIAEVFGLVSSRLDAEIESHLDELSQRHRERGLSPEEARLAARRDFGGVTRTREDYGAQAGWRWVDKLRQDVRYASRALYRSPGFTAIATLTLALGIGATTVIFSVVNSALLRPLPYDGGERLVRLRAVVMGPDGQPRRIPVNLSAQERNVLAERTRSLDHVATAIPWLMNWRGHEPRWQGARVSASIFPMLGVQPRIGRVFQAEDERPGANTLILSASAWQRDFGSDPNVLGRTVTLEAVLGPPESAVYTVVGVMPEQFEYPNWRVMFWIPFASSATTGPPPRLPTTARLAEGVSPEAAATEVTPILRQLASDAQAGGQRPGPTIASYEVIEEHAERVRLVRPALLALSGAVAFVFLIACVNAASLMLTRTAARQREIAIRTAIGAGRGRLVRLIAMESLLLAVVASLVGGAIAVGGVRTLRWLTGAPYRFDVDIDGRNTFPGLESITLDGSVLWFTMLLALIAAVLLAIPPALYYMRAAPAATLRNGSGATLSAGANAVGRFGLGNLLVVVEVAMAMMLLVGGGLLMASFVRLMDVDPGYTPAGVVTFQVALPTEQYPVARVRGFAETLTERLHGLAGVESAAYGNQLPMVGLRDTAGGLWRTPDPSRRFGQQDAADARIVSHEYLQTLRIPLVAGRGLSEADNEGGEHVLLVNEALARRDFGGRDAIGQSVYVGNDPQPWRIVGIVGDVRQFWLSLPPEPQFFFDARQWSGRGPLFPVGAYYAVRTSGDPLAVAAAVERAVKEIEPQAVVFNIAPMESLVTATVGRPRLYAVLLGFFAVIGLTLAVLGIYGVISSGVARRTREIGVRMALGARRGDVLSMVLRAAIALTSTGIVIGVLGAAAVTRFLETMLFGITPLDGPTFVGMAALFAFVAAIAAFIPARRATRVDPLIALKAE